MCIRDSGVEDRYSDPFRCEHVGIRARCPFDQSVEAEATKVVTHLRRAVVPAEESGDMPAKALVAEAGDGVDHDAECAGQGHGALIPEAKCPGSLALMCVGLVDALKERRADGTALAGTFDHKQTVVDLACLLDKLGEMLEPGKDTDVLGFVDDGFDTQCPPFLQILLDTAVLVAEVHLHLGAGAEDPGPEGLGGGATPAAPTENGVDFMGTADADVVLDQGLEEAACPAGVVEDQRAGDLHLASAVPMKSTPFSVGAAGVAPPPSPSGPGSSAPAPR